MPHLYTQYEKRMKGGQKSAKTAKTVFWPALMCAQNQKAGQNTNHHATFVWSEDFIPRMVKKFLSLILVDEEEKNETRKYTDQQFWFCYVHRTVCMS